MAIDIAGLRQALTGISGILVTPFDGDGDIAPMRLPPIIDRAVRAGVHLLVANGNTGEFYALTSAEAEAMVESVVAQVAGRVPVIGGVGRGVREACALARASHKAGVDALMVHQPPDPFVSPRGVIDYVRRIADAAEGLPLVIYLRDDSIGLDAIAGLCAIGAVAGVKWASPTPLRLTEAIARCDDHLVWVGGLAETWAPVLYAAGARGFTSGLINVWPEKSVAIHAALAAGNLSASRDHIRGIAAFEGLRAQERNGTNVSAVKAALQLMGLDCGPARPPAGWPLAEEALEELRKLLETWR